MQLLHLSTVTLLSVRMVTLNTFAFVASPELTCSFRPLPVISALYPLKDTLTNADGEQVKLAEPQGSNLPAKGFVQGDNGYIAPTGASTEINIDPFFQPLAGSSTFSGLGWKRIIEYAFTYSGSGQMYNRSYFNGGPWLRFRGHLENISDNMLMGAVNASMEKHILFITARLVSMMPFLLLQNNTSH